MTDKGVRREATEQDPGGVSARSAQLRERRHLNNGFGNAMSNAFELAATPALFGGLGWWIDGRTGTGHVFTLALFLFAVVGVFVKLWIGYDAEMTRQEAAMPHNAKATRQAATPQ